jgi:hypothetical protein
MKYCPDCGYKRPKSEFGNNKNFKDGKQPYCLTHYRIRRKQYARTQRGKETEKNRKLKFRESGKQSQYNKSYYREHRERILSSKSVETIAGILSDSRTESFKEGNNKLSSNTSRRRKTIVLNPRPVRRES